MTHPVVIRTSNSGVRLLETIQAGRAAWDPVWVVVDGSTDGQYPAAQIPALMAASQARPEAMVLGVPQFGPDSPALRVGGRCISNGFAQLETGWAGIGDSLFGFRVCPIARLLPIMQRSRWMRRFDFNPEAAVRLSWDGVPAVNLPVPVRCLQPEEGGVSHFRYGQDNLLLFICTRGRSWVRWPGCRRGLGETPVAGPAN